MNTNKRTLVLLTVVWVAHQTVAFAGTPVGTTITYQGQLKEAGVPLNGNVDLQFELFDAAVDGNPIGSLLLVQDVPVVKGLFSVELDFGAAAFTGDARWAQIEVQVPQDGGGTLVVPLSPRQLLSGVPYAMFSLAPWRQDGTDVSYIQGNVGIGTTAPGSPLTLAGPNNVGAASASIEIDNTTPVTGRRWVVRSSTEGMFQVADATAGGVSRLVIDENGNVGIGTTAPQKALHLDLPSNANEGILLAKAGTLNGTQLAVSGSNNQIFSIDIDPNNVSAFEQFQVTYNGGPPVLMINSDGNVGIGTTEPELPLHVTGGNLATLDGGGYIVIGDPAGFFVVIDNRGIMARQADGRTANLLLNRFGGDATFGGGATFAGIVHVGYEIVQSNVEGNSAIATCPVGKSVLGGGCESLGATLGTILRSHPVSNGLGWSCVIEEGPFGFDEVTAYAICANIR